VSKEPSYLDYKLMKAKDILKYIIEFLPWLLFAWYPIAKLPDSDAADSEKLFLSWLCLLETFMYGGISIFFFGSFVGVSVVTALILLTAVVLIIIDYKAWRYVYRSDRHG